MQFVELCMIYFENFFTASLLVLLNAFLYVGLKTIKKNFLYLLFGEPKEILSLKNLRFKVQSLKRQTTRTWVGR